MSEMLVTEQAVREFSHPSERFVPDLPTLNKSRTNLTTLEQLSLLPWVAALDRRNEGNALAIEIGERIADGEAINDIARNLMGEAKGGRLMMWLQADETRYAFYCAGYRARADGVAMEGLQIVDATEGDPTAVPSAKLRTEYRRWMVGKWDRARFGDDAKQQLNVGVGVRINVSREDMGLL